MYVEVSRRQCGKTLRLIKAIYDWLGENDCNIAWIVAINTLESRRILSQIQTRYKHRVEVKQHMVDRIEKAIGDNYKYFVDEFDFIDESKLLFNPNAYYCTTAKKKRDFENKDDYDLFTHLVKEAKRRNCFHSQEFTSHDYLKENLTSDQYDLEVKNEFEVKLTKNEKAILIIDKIINELNELKENLNDKDL